MARVSRPSCYPVWLVLPVVVVIDIVPAEVPGEQAQALVDACSSAVTRGACALATATPESARPAAVAMVLWQGPDFFEATVRVGRRDGEWASRKLAFSEADPTRERWVAAGLTIATLLDEARAESPAAAPTIIPSSPTKPPAPAAPPQPSIQPPAPRPVEPPTPGHAARTSGSDLGMSAGLLVGHGWDQSGPMTGGWATLMLNTFQDRFVALVGGSFATSNGPTLPSVNGLGSRWLGVELGWGVQGSLAPFRFVAVPELAFQSVRVASPEGETRSAQATYLKLRLAVVWEASTRWGLSLGAGVRALPVEAPSIDPGLRRRSGAAGELQAGIEFRP